MSSSLLTPDLRRILDDLARRLGILERRVKPPVSPGVPVIAHTHDGTGGASTVVSDSTGTPAVASDSFATAVGDSAAATNDYSTAVGFATTASGIESTAAGVGATASGVDATAVGPGAIASAQASVAVGYGAVAAHTGSVAIGEAAHSTNTRQIVLGGHGDTYAPNVIIGIRDAFSSADLANRQMAFYADETFDLLVVTVKYSTGVVKTAQIALS